MHSALREVYLLLLLFLEVDDALFAFLYTFFTYYKKRNQSLMHVEKREFEIFIHCFLFQGIWQVGKVNFSIPFSPTSGFNTWK
jgi:hypothetical protein